jgi:hypothetical protein
MLRTVGAEDAHVLIAIDRAEGDDRDIYLVLDQFDAQIGRAWRETDEEDTDFETLVRHLLEDQYSNPVRVVAFNTAEDWSRGVSDDVADELRGAVQRQWQDTGITRGGHNWTSRFPWNVEAALKNLHRRFVLDG